MDNIFNYIHYDMFKVLSSKDREFNYDILIYLYNYFCFQQGGAKAIKNDDILADKELLADILTVGINNTLEQVKKDKNSKLGKYTNGLGGLF